MAGQKIPDDASTKCTKWNPVSGEGGPCWMLERCLKPANGNIPVGLSMYVLTRIPSEGKPYAKRHAGYSFKRSSKEKGTLLKFCPFCGENIDYHKEGYDETPIGPTAESEKKTAAVLVAP